MKDDEAMRPCVHQHGSTAFFIEVQDFLFHLHGSQWNWRLVIPLFLGAMLNPFPKETSSFSTIQPSNTQISDSTDNRMEHLLLKMEDSQRQHQHTLLQVLHIVPRRNWILPFFSKMFFSPHPSLVKLFSKQWLPSWERSHIPSQLALLSRWFSELHSRWDILVPWRVIIHLILPNRNYGGSFI